MTEILYKVAWDTSALHDLKKISRTIGLSIENKVETYLAKAPRELGKRLSGLLSAVYSYRYDDYRILYRIIEAEKAIVITKIGHRRNVYE